MARRSLSDALDPKPDADSLRTRPAPVAAVETTPPAPIAQRVPSPAAPSDPPDRYKLTVVLEEDEHRQLEALTAAVLAEIQPRRVGKGWRTKVIRALLADAMAGAEPDERAVRRIARRVRDA